MTLSDLGNIGELVGAIAVLVTLIYLAIQLRQNTLAIKAQTYQEVYRDLRENLMHLDRDFIERSIEGNLTVADRAYYDLFLLVSLRAYENWWNHYNYGTITEDVFLAYISHMRKMFESDDAMIWYGRVKETHDFTPGFLEFVNGYLSEKST